VTLQESARLVLDERDALAGGTNKPKLATLGNSKGGADKGVGSSSASLTVPSSSGMGRSRSKPKSGASQRTPRRRAHDSEYSSSTVLSEEAASRPQSPGMSSDSTSSSNTRVTASGVAQSHPRGGGETLLPHEHGDAVGGDSVDHSAPRVPPGVDYMPRLQPSPDPPEADVTLEEEEDDHHSDGGHGGGYLPQGHSVEERAAVFGGRHSPDDLDEADEPVPPGEAETVVSLVPVPQNDSMVFGVQSATGKRRSSFQHEQSGSSDRGMVSRQRSKSEWHAVKRSPPPSGGVALLPLVLPGAGMGVTNVQMSPGGLMYGLAQQRIDSLLHESIRTDRSQADRWVRKEDPHSFVRTPRGSRLLGRETSTSEPRVVAPDDEDEHSDHPLLPPSTSVGIGFHTESLGHSHARVEGSSSREMRWPSPSSGPRRGRRSFHTKEDDDVAFAEQHVADDDPHADGFPHTSFGEARLPPPTADPSTASGRPRMLHDVGTDSDAQSTSLSEVQGMSVQLRASVRPREEEADSFANKRLRVAEDSALTHSDA
jgi:hypothetical protein